MQSNYDAFISSKQIEKLVGYECEHFATFDLRDFSPIERCEFIDYELFCGDCLEVMKGLADGCADMILCDL